MSDLYIETRLQAIKDISSASCADIKDADNIASFCDEIYSAIPKIDKVVEELDCDRCENCSFLEVCAGSKCCTRCHEKIIEIVKQGCVGTETIRDKAVKWNNNSSKKAPYEFIDYVEGKRDIEEAEDCCEWISASDGEFIQNPHTKRLYSNEPSMKNIYCNTCGKKIKVM